MLDGEYDPEENYKENKYFANSWQSSRARMYPLLTEKIVRCFNGSDFTGQDIIAGEEPVSVYLRIPERQLEAKAPLIRLVLESLTAEMFDTFDEPQGHTCRPVLLILDEAGTVGFPSLPHFSSTCAGRGISIWTALQDLSQLDGLYGVHKARTVRNNMGAKVFFRPEDYATAKSISDTLGLHLRLQPLPDHPGGGGCLRGTSRAGRCRLNAAGADGTWRTGTPFFLSATSNPRRGNRMEYWRFPLLEKRRAYPSATSQPPAGSAGDAASLCARTASSWERQRRWPRFPIDPDDLN